MKITDRAVDMLKKLESGLQELVAEAAKAADYESAMQLTSCARQIAALIARMGSPAGVSETAVPPVDSLATAAPSQKGQTGRKSKALISREYPKFFRQGDDLIKVGWSKREKKEYQHKAPQKILLLVAAQVAKVGFSGKLFTTDQLLPVIDPSDGGEVPGYQAYVCLAWLRNAGLVQQHGRQGYTVPKTESFDSSLEECWQQLPQL